MSETNVDTPPLTVSPAEDKKMAEELQKKAVMDLKPEPQKLPCPKCGKKEMVKQLDWSNGHSPGYWCPCGHTQPRNWALPTYRQWAQCAAHDTQVLLKLSPNNPTTRAVVENLAHGDRIPEWLTKADEIITWFDSHQSAARPQGLRPRRRNTHGGFVVSCVVREMETGRCKYSVHRSGSMNTELTVADIEQLINNAVEDGYTVDDLAQRIKRHVLEDNFPDDIETSQDEDSLSHDDYESTDVQTEERSVRFSRDELEAYLQAHYPDALDSLLDNGGGDNEDADEDPN